MSTWVKGNTGVFKRKQGLYARKTTATPPPAAGIWRSSFATMDFAAVYQADWPGSLDFDTALSNAGLPTQGVNVSGTAFSPLFSGQSTAINAATFTGGVGATIVAEVLYPAAGAWTAAGAQGDLLGNPDLFFGGPATAGQSGFYTDAGMTQNGFGGVAGPFVPLVANDVVGLVYNSDPFGSGLTFYINGVQITNVLLQNIPYRGAIAHS